MTDKTNLTSNLSKIRPAFRTKGSFAGNFGSGRRTGGSKYNEALVSNRENVGNFPTNDEYRQRLESGLPLASGRTRDFILAELRRLNIQRQSSTWRNPQGAYCSLDGHHVSAAQ